MASSGWGAPQPARVRLDLVKQQHKDFPAAPTHHRRLAKSSTARGLSVLGSLAETPTREMPKPTRRCPPPSDTLSPTGTSQTVSDTDSVREVRAVQHEWLERNARVAAEGDCGGVLLPYTSVLSEAVAGGVLTEAGALGTCHTSSIFGSALVEVEDLDTFGWRSKTSVQTSRVRVRHEVRPSASEDNHSHSDPTPSQERDVSFSATLPGHAHGRSGETSVAVDEQFKGTSSFASSSFGASDVSFAYRAYSRDERLDKRRAQCFSYRPDIDGLRAVAVIAVILFHVDESWLPGGFVGVDIFFVISGYVVAGSLLGRAACTSASEYLVAFYARRLKRLSPALVAVTCITALLLSLLVDPSTEALTSYFDSGMLALVGWANNYFATLGEGAHRRRLANNYFGPPPDSVGDRPPEQIGESELSLNPFLHYWSLGVEEQFYVVFPLLVLAAFSKRVVKPPANLSVAAMPDKSPTPTFMMADQQPPPSKERGRGRGLLWGFMLLGIGIAGWMTQVHPQLAFYLLPPRLWELLAGAVLFDLRARGAGWQWVPDECGTPIIAALDLSSWLGIAMACVTTRDEANFPFPWTLLPVGGTLCFIAAGWAKPRKVRLGGFQLPTPLFNALCSHPACTYTGRLSYPLYLWHWPLIALFRHTCGMQHGGNKVGVIAATVGAAVLTYHGLEVHVRKWRPRRHWHVFAVMIPVLGLAEVWLAILRTPLAGKLYVPGSDRLGALPGDPLELSPPTLRFVLQPVGTECPHCVSPGVMKGPDAFGRYPLRGTVTLSGKLTCGCVAPTGENAFPSRYVPPCFLCVNPSCQADARNDEPASTRLQTWPGVKPRISRPKKGNIFDLYGDRCFLNQENPDVALHAVECLTPNRVVGASRTVFLIGDSHGASLVPGLMTGVAGAAMVRWVAITWDVAPRASDGKWPLANGVNAAVVETLRKHLRPGDAVLFMQAAYRFTELCFRSDCGPGAFGDALHFGRANSAEGAESARAETEAYLRDLQFLANPRGVPLVLLGDWGIRPCNWNWDGWTSQCNIAWEENNQLYLDKINPTFRGLATDLPGVFFLDLNDRLCPDEGGPLGVCSNFLPGPEPGTVSGTAAMHDDDHLSHAGAMFLWPTFCEYFATTLGWPSA